MPFPAIIALAPAIMPQTAAIVSAGILGAGGLIIKRYRAIIRSLSDKPSSSSRSKAAKESKRRQEEMLQKRRATGEQFAEFAQDAATASAAGLNVLQAEERQAATLVMDTATTIKAAAEALLETEHANANTLESIKADIAQQDILVEKLKSISAKLDTQTRLLDEKKEEIDTLLQKLTRIQNDASKRQKMVEVLQTRIKELTTLTDHQAATIQNLRGQQSELLSQNTKMAELLERYMQSDRHQTTCIARQSETIETLRQQNAELSKTVIELTEELNATPDTPTQAKLGFFS